MGGKKKLGIKQMEKQQVKTDEDKAKDAKKKEKTGPPKERKTVGIMVPDAKDQRNISEIKKMGGVLTPYTVATRFGIRISAAKDYLEELEANGSVQLVSGSHNIKIYKPAA
jgi:small subunit ribosomal protein S25e